MEVLQALEVLEVLEMLEVLEGWSVGRHCHSQHHALTVLCCSCLSFPSAAASAREG